MQTVFKVIILCTIMLILIILDRKVNLGEIHRNSKHVTIKASDGNEYTVIRGHTKDQAVRMLVRVRAMSERLLEMVQSNCMDACEGARIMLNRVRNSTVQFTELMPESPNDPVAININKGESIQLCLFDRQRINPVQMDALFTVVVHELAHMMDKTISAMQNGHSLHSGLFKRHEAFLMQYAHRLNIVPDGGAIGAMYCGIRIPDPSVSQ